MSEIQPWVLSRPAEFDETMVRVTVAHAAEGAPRVDVHVTANGSKTPAIGPEEISISNGGVYTVLARDLEGLSGGGLTLMDDFVVDD